MGLAVQVPGILCVSADSTGWIFFPAHALLIVEERLKDQAAEGVLMPEGMPLDELALRVLIAAATAVAARRPQGLG
jgi:hypothetical protein